MSHDVGLLSVLNDGLVHLRWLSSTSSDPDALWSKSKLRKTFTCAVSGVEMLPGEYAFRPLGNQDYRYQRISPIVITLLIHHAVMEDRSADPGADLPAPGHGGAGE